MGKLKNKRGSTTVFICMVLATTLLMAGFFGEAAGGVLSRPYADSVIDLAGRSILSEYDKTLKDRYGLFGFQLNEEELEKLMDKYVGESFKKYKGKIGLLPLKINKVEVDISEFSLTDIYSLEEQIVDHMKYQVILDTLDLKNILSSFSPTAPGKNEKEREAEDPKKMRTLRNGKIINGLPSRQLKGIESASLELIDIPHPDRFGKVAYNELCLNRYIINCFSNNLDSLSRDDTFFSNEIEYILCGRLSDEANKNIVYLSLLTFRTLVNSAHIYADSAKWNAVTAAAAVAGGGVGTIAAQAAIVAAWAGAEAAMDMHRLGEGGKVPLAKTASDWVLSLESVLEGSVLPAEKPKEDEKGLAYEDYLFLMLFFKSKESKLVRIMDLIQLNLKGTVNDEFIMSGCSTGFRYHMELNRINGFPGLSSFRRGSFSGAHIY